MSSTTTVYLKPEKNSEVHDKDVFLSQAAKVWCRDKALESKCKAIKLMTIHDEKENRYVCSVLDVVEKIQKLDANAEVTNLGEMDFIIDYQPKVRRIGAADWVKTAAVCLIVFFGAAFAIMTFNNDGSVAEIFKDVYYLVMNEESDGITVLEVGYSIGLLAGVLIFFNHFGKRKLTTDPTPIEVQMRIYEDEVDTTIIKNASRKESGIDVR
jgi:stage V sporulation protein AA